MLGLPPKVWVDGSEAAHLNGCFYVFAKGFCFSAGGRSENPHWQKGDTSLACIRNRKGHQRSKLTHHLQALGCMPLYSPTQPGASRSPQGYLQACPYHICSCLIWAPGVADPQTCFPSDSWHLVLWALAFLVYVLNCLLFYFSPLKDPINSRSWQQLKAQKWQLKMSPSTHCNLTPAVPNIVAPDTVHSSPGMPPFLPNHTSVQTGLYLV